MKLKVFALFVALLFVGTATLAAASHDHGICPPPKPRKRFSGDWGVTFFDPCTHKMQNPQLGRVKGQLLIKKRFVKAVGVLCLDGKCNDPNGGIFNIRLYKDKTPCGKMMHGVFKGTLKLQWDCEKIGDCDCEYDPDDCYCYEHVYDWICCSKSKAPFTGDWFIYHGWLMIMGTIHAYVNGEYDHKVWLKAYIGSWSYPGIECYP
ncbi:MAG TPA: hypothetical protein ENI42_01715 [Thermoplasmatales archaeon]|nr:hypothetical protein [Thermoplasmatales archaeon]